MKFVRFEYRGKVFLGMVKGEEITVLDGSLFDRYEETRAHYPLSDVKLLPPVLPTKIVCIGRNYRGHIEEIGAEVPEEPEVFLKGVADFEKLKEWVMAEDSPDFDTIKELLLSQEAAMKSLTEKISQKEDVLIEKADELVEEVGDISKLARGYDSAATKLKAAATLYEDAISLMKSEEKIEENSPPPTDSARTWPASRSMTTRPRPIAATCRPSICPPS